MKNYQTLFQEKIKLRYTYDKDKNKIHETDKIK